MNVFLMIFAFEAGKWEYLWSDFLFFVIILKMMGVKLTFFLALMVLLPHFHCLNWQGTGVLSYDMQNTIWNYINTNFDPSVTYNGLMLGNKAIVNFSKGLSNELNSRFDRAWNVVVPYISEFNNNADTVLYGYAFKDHWFWYNGYKMNDGYYVSFIIWKDYNCQTYITFDPTKDSYSTFTGADATAITNAINSLKGSWRYDDPWKAAQGLVDYLQKMAFSGRNAAFTVVFGQSYTMYPFSTVCALKYSLKVNVGVNGQATGGNAYAWATPFILQMR